MPSADSRKFAGYHWPRCFLSRALTYHTTCYSKPEGEFAFQQLKEDYYPGDIGFDPLGLKPEDPEEYAAIQTKELQNGRLAMLGAAGMIAQELVK